MGNFLKKSRLVLAISMVVQAITMLVLFFTNLSRRRGLAYTFLGICAASTAASGYLFWQWREDKKDAKERAELAQQMKENPDSFEIPLDEDASEKEFR